MSLHYIPDELKDLQKIEKILIYKRMKFKNERGEFATIKGSICNIHIERASVCDILPRPASSTD